MTSPRARPFHLLVRCRAGHLAAVEALRDATESRAACVRRLIREALVRLLGERTARSVLAAKEAPSPARADPLGGPEEQARDTTPPPASGLRARCAFAERRRESAFETVSVRELKPRSARRLAGFPPDADPPSPQAPLGVGVLRGGDLRLRRW
jgi:hypothetical protein